MKHTQLTVEQIDLIRNCLYIASNIYYEQFKQLKELNKNTNDKITDEHTAYWYNKSCLIQDLADELRHKSQIP
jgi:6-phosphogluconate dehydrogenase